MKQFRCGAMPRFDITACWRPILNCNASNATGPGVAMAGYLSAEHAWFFLDNCTSDCTSTSNQTLQRLCLQPIKTSHRSVMLTSTLVLIEKMNTVSELVKAKYRTGLKTCSQARTGFPWIGQTH